LGQGYSLAGPEPWSRNSLERVPAKKRKRAPRRIPDLDQVVDITIELLEKHGESGFRIEDLMERTGISKSSLYLRFGSRDGLLATAYSKVFKSLVMESVTGLAAIINRARTPDELRAGLHAATAFVASPQRFKQRLERAAIIAGIRGRPDFYASLSQAQIELTQSVAALFKEAQRKGLINIKHSPRTGAQLIQALTLGRIIAEIEDPQNTESPDDWINLANDLIDHMMFDGLVND
jgi:AcrR family transcriptional regulator